MIESISIADIATYGKSPEEMNCLSQFNFMFGSNGTGKTTVSRIIAAEALFPTCKVTWQGGTKLQPMVYNRDFVDHNFTQSSELKGVFTLGEKQLDTLSKIATAKTEQDSLTVKIESLTQGLAGDDGRGGKQQELMTLGIRFREKCWSQKQKHDDKLQGAFGGYRNSAEKFKDKVLTEHASNSALLMTLPELEKKAESVFGSTAQTIEQSVSKIDATSFLDHESNPILRKRVIGRDEVDIAAMITKLGNSDWVREGRHFFAKNEGACPFCQQATPDALARSLKEYFDETFETDSKSIDDLAANYKSDSSRFQQRLDLIITTGSPFLDLEKVKAEKQLLDSQVRTNIEKLKNKKKEPSQVVELESHRNVVEAITALIASANSSVAKHNNIVSNLAQERATLTAQVWKYVLEELKDDLASYVADRTNVIKAIESMNAQLTKAKADKAKKAGEIRELEKHATSVQPTIDGINAVLASFGFKGFSLAKAVNGISYKLVRADGTDAKSTLSEGEKTFVSFLYFYHLLKGSDSDSGVTTDRVVVFDDPVSSLDSDILFIVGSLIKGLFNEVRAETGHIKQIFILTHNVYFHKEVTFNPKRCDVAMKEETFWIVRKPDLVSKIDRHNSNPIKTSYELLWNEVRSPGRSNLTIQNTLRRILENYFKILGGVDPDRICELFEGKERLICKSLFSWVNDGSHYAYDDLYVSTDDSAVDIHLKIFRAIFKKSDHMAHYKMMMGDAFVEEIEVV